MQIRALTTTGLCLGLAAALLNGSADGQMPAGQSHPPMVSQTSYMAAEGMPPGISQAMHQQSRGPMPPGYIAQVGYGAPTGCSSCDAGGYGGCDGCSCGGGSGPGGLLGQICQGGELNGLQNLCVFCCGSGCSVCQAPSNIGNAWGWLGMLAPYTEAGLCAQRWYDFQAEAMFLSMQGSSANQALTSRGVGVINPVTGEVEADIVLGTDDVSFEGLSPGFRLTGSMIFGAGGNIEATYFGSHHFSESARMTATTNPDGTSTFDLFSVFSDFGTAPAGGFPDTDQASINSLNYKSDIHSGEVNYRRRWVGPCCRFQGSWLAGFRYFDLDESLALDIRGAIDDDAAIADTRFFNNRTQTRNALSGAQLGGDLWWNLYPGVNLGVGWKGAILGNRAEQNTVIRADSLNLVPGIDQVNERASDSTTAYLSELEARLAYRLSYAWTFTAAYWYIGVDGLALGTGNVNTAQVGRLVNNPPIPRTVTINLDDSITMHGFSVGLEYLW